ncbi:hypothetical protein F5Y09DRAFT_354400 [Xylaria sp. FL1042]|nr:hypothetical protein F5Y09DRAFT_354400 [Xylaria sp. FL1042]
MEDFKLEKVIMTITERMAKSHNVEEMWKRFLPQALFEEIHETETLISSMGSKTLVSVQQCICRRMWEFLFPKETPPWPVINTFSLGVGEEMKPSQLKDILAVATKDYRVALRVLSTNLMDAEANRILEEVRAIRAAKESRKVTTPAIPKTTPAIPKTTPAIPKVTTSTISKVSTPAPSQASTRGSTSASTSTSTPAPIPAPVPAPAPAPKPILKTTSKATTQPDPKPAVYSSTGTTEGSLVTTGARAWQSWALGNNPTVSSSQISDAQMMTMMSESSYLREEFKKFLAQGAQRFPQLPPGIKPQLGSGPALTSGTTSALHPGASQPVAPQCPFSSWKDESGNPLPCIPGAGPGQIPLPDNLDPVTYLLPIKMDLEAWLNVDFYFVSRSVRSDRNLIVIMPGKVRGKARPAEVDERYGLVAFNILTQWTDEMIRRGTMIPVVEFIRQSFGVHTSFDVLRKQTRQLLAPMAQRTRYPRPIKTITVNDMKKGISVADSKTLDRSPYDHLEDTLIPLDYRIEITPYLNGFDNYLDDMDDTDDPN